MQSWCEGKCCYEYVGEHLQTSGSLLGSMSIAKLTSIRTVIRSTCEMNGKLTALTTVQESSGCNMAETYESLIYWYQGEQSGFDANKTRTKKTTCNTSQLSKSIRSKESKGSNLRYLDSGCHDTLEATTMSVSCAEPILFMWVWYLRCWESLKIHWLNYHHCHCPHWSLIYAHCGRKSMSPLSNRPTWIWICTDFFPTHPVFFLISNTSVSKAMATRRASH